ncbi:MAG: amidohydrolase family protein [Hyphomicrobiaceae bacterium]
MSKRGFTVRWIMFLCTAFLTTMTLADAFAAEEAQSQILFTNCNIFDGRSDKLTLNHRVLVEGNLIKTIGDAPIKVRKGSAVVDCGGRTLMPGLIDNHVHLVLPGPTIPAMDANKTWEDLAIHGVAQAEMYLMQGFTTVRDAGGANGGLQRAVNAGTIKGPRIYPSGAFIGGRGGHADFAQFTAPMNAESNMARLNIARDVDGADATLKAARNNFRMGASQIKIMQSGGVVSTFDPWQMEGRTVKETKAAVEIANQYGTYVMAHSYRKRSILRALNAGVRSIEHGFMYDCEIAELMKEKRAYITTNLTAFDPNLTDIPAIKNNPSSLRKALSASSAFKNYIDNMRKCPAKRGHHTDCVGTISACKKQIAYEKYLNGKFFGNHTALVSMTSIGGEIAAMTGDFMNPYPEGKLGVVEEGAYADVLIVEGNPLEDLTVIGTFPEWQTAPERPDSPKSILLIMKDGQIYKNTL